MTKPTTLRSEHAWQAAVIYILYNVVADMQSHTNNIANGSVCHSRKDERVGPCPTDIKHGVCSVNTSHDRHNGMNKVDWTTYHTDGNLHKT